MNKRKRQFAVQKMKQKTIQAIILHLWNRKKKLYFTAIKFIWDFLNYDMQFRFRDFGFWFIIWHMSRTNSHHETKPLGFGSALLVYILQSLKYANVWTLSKSWDETSMSSATAKCANYWDNRCLTLVLLDTKREKIKLRFFSHKRLSPD